jgi:vacuolar-type H+-ATPase subunit I/STV1
LASIFTWKKYFQQIRDLLKNAAAKYRAQNPITEKTRKALQRQSTRLEAELNILQNELENKRLAQEFAKDYPGVDYTATIQGKINKLQSELNRIKPFIETGQLQPLVPK